MSTLDSLVATIKARGVARVYKMNEVPTGAVYPYAVVGLGSPDKIARTTDGQAGDLHRATVQFYGRDLDGVLDIAEKADLDGVWLTSLAGEPLCTRELSTSPYRDPDTQGVLNVLHTYRF